MPRFNLDEYISVQERINQFWQQYPDGAIATFHESPKDDFKQCRYRAAVFHHRDDMMPIATGWAFEIAGGNSANATSHEENCETSAIGRALANLGYATSQKDRPSREEMEKVERMSEPVRMEPRQRQQVEATYEQVSRANAAAPDASYPAVSRQHGINNMADLNNYLQSQGFRGGNKGDCIRELEETYHASIAPAHGRREPDGRPTIFPGDIYDFAAFHIDRMSDRPLALEGEATDVPGIGGGVW